MKVMLNSQYQDRANMENIDAITDKMVLDDFFLAEILNAKIDIDYIIKVNGFNLTGKVNEIFANFVNSMREDLYQIINKV